MRRNPTEELAIKHSKTTAEAAEEAELSSEGAFTLWIENEKSDLS